MVLWIRLGDDGIDGRIKSFFVREDDTKVVVSISAGAPCLALAALGYPYAFLEIPIIDKPFELSVQSLECSQ